MVPPEVTETLGDMAEGALYVAGAWLAAVIAVKVLKFMTLGIWWRR